MSRRETAGLIEHVLICSISINSIISSISTSIIISILSGSITTSRGKGAEEEEEMQEGERSALQALNQN